MEGEDVMLTSAVFSGEKYHSGDEEAAMKSLIERQYQGTLSKISKITCMYSRGSLLWWLEGGVQLSYTHYVL